MIAYWQHFISFSDKDLTDFVHRVLVAVLIVTVCQVLVTVLKKRLSIQMNRKKYSRDIRQLNWRFKILHRACVNKDSSVTEKTIDPFEKSFVDHIVSMFNATTLMLPTRVNSRGILERPEVVRDAETVRHSAGLIFDNLDFNRSGDVDLEELGQFFPPRTAQQVLETIAPQGRGSFGREEFDDFVLAVFRKTTELQSSLQDFKDVQGIINLVINGIFWMLMFFIVVWELGWDLTNVLTLLATMTLTLSFALGPSIQRFLEAVLFLLVEQPFEVGDSIYLETSSSTKLWVQRIQLYTTTLSDAQGRAYYIPNHMLSGMKVINIKRGGSAPYEVQVDGELSSAVSCSLCSMCGLCERKSVRANWSSSVAAFLL